jgi:hypothetical protein
LVCDILNGIYGAELGEEKEPPTRLKDIIPLIRRKVKRVPPKANLVDVKVQPRTAPPDVKCWHCGENYFTFTCETLPLCDHCKFNNHATAFCEVCSSIQSTLDHPLQKPYLLQPKPKLPTLLPTINTPYSCNNCNMGSSKLLSTPTPFFGDPLECGGLSIDEGTLIVFLRH